MNEICIWDFWDIEKQIERVRCNKVENSNKDSSEFAELILWWIIFVCALEGQKQCTTIYIVKVSCRLIRELCI